MQKTYSHAQLQQECLRKLQKAFDELCEIAVLGRMTGLTIELSASAYGTEIPNDKSAPWSARNFVAT